MNLELPPQRNRVLRRCGLILRDEGAISMWIPGSHISVGWGLRCGFNVSVHCHAESQLCALIHALLGQSPLKPR